MALVEMLMPKMGESIMEGTVLKWLKNVGDRIEEDESVLEVATDKVDTEVPAVQAGVLHEILAQEGDVIPVGKAIAVIDTEAGAEPGDKAAPVTQAEINIPVTPTAATAAPQPENTTIEAKNSNEFTSGSHHGSVTEGRFYSPLVMNIARQEPASAGYCSGRKRKRARPGTSCPGNRPRGFCSPTCGIGKWRPGNYSNGPDAQNDCPAHGR
jgi:2-oxoglutarate dehydrogenase E2 component (dihydrolipoamide succinyltransferase)